ncbi:hypothetical protein T01_3185 [Trichinella spiralis]|uniref:Uncharacterized protein n=1 Tax=Trichinella spiralis TaxID=6334 RepID=A0A0V1BMQ4_TRISP|nr:hypothetical protein T01_3185 [Trichinella spiralis]
MFRTEQHRPSRCDLAWGWWPEVAGRMKTIPAYRRPDRYLGICRPRPGQWLFTTLRQLRVNKVLEEAARLTGTPKRPSRASSPAVSEPPIGGPSEPPAGAVGPRSIYLATSERHMSIIRVVVVASRTHCRLSNRRFHPNKRTYIRCVFRSACILPDAIVFLTTQYSVGQEESTLYSPLSFARRSNVWQIVPEHRERTEPSYGSYNIHDLDGSIL